MVNRRDESLPHLERREMWGTRLAGGPPFVFGKVGFRGPAWDLWILRMLARSCISVRTGEDEKEAGRCMSPRLPTFAKNKGAKVGHPSQLVSVDPRSKLEMQWPQATK